MIVYLRWFHWRLRRQSLLLEEKVPQCTLGRMWCAVHSYDYRNTSAKTYCRNTTSVSLRETASTKGTLRSPQGEAFAAHPTLVEPSRIRARNDPLSKPPGETLRIRRNRWENVPITAGRPQGSPLRGWGLLFRPDDPVAV